MTGFTCTPFSEFSEGQYSLYGNFSNKVFICAAATGIFHLHVNSSEVPGLTCEKLSEEEVVAFTMNRSCDICFQHTPPSCCYLRFCTTT